MTKKIEAVINNVPTEKRKDQMISLVNFTNI